MQEPELHADHRWQNRTVHREIDARQMQRVWKLLLAIVVALTPTAFYLVQINESVKLDYQVNRLRAKEERLREEKQRLGIERARLQSLERIEDWAIGGQGLVRPGPHRVVMVRETPEDAGDLMAADSPGDPAAIR